MIQYVGRLISGTISGTTCLGTNPEAPTGLVLVPVNTRDNTDRRRKENLTEYQWNIDRKPSKHR